MAGHGVYVTLDCATEVVICFLPIVGVALKILGMVLMCVTFSPDGVVSITHREATMMHFIHFSYTRMKSFDYHT